MSAAGGRLARRAAHAALAGVAAAALLAAWVTVREILISPAYRQAPVEILHLAAVSLLWYAPLLAPASVTISALLAAVRAPAWSGSPAPAHAGVAATLFVMVYGLGSFTGESLDPLALPWTGWIGLGALALTSVGAGVAAARLASAAGASRRLAGAVQAAWGAGWCVLGALVAWSLLREHVGFPARSLAGLLAAGGSLAAGAVTGGGAVAALRAGAGLWTRGISPARAAALFLGTLAGAAAVLWGGTASWTAAPARPEGGRPNVLVLVADTLRADRVGAYGASRTRTPALDGLAAAGATFARAIAPASWTLPSTASLLTGLYPSSHGLTTYKEEIRRDAVDLAAILGRAGYATAGFVANPVLAAGHGFGRDFDLWDDKVGIDGVYRHWRTPLATSLRRLGVWMPPDTFPRAGEVVDGALDWLRDKGQAPFFLYLHFMDPHDPYAPPPPYDTMYGGRGEGTFSMGFGTLPDIMKAQVPVGPPDLEAILALYDGEVTSLDHRIGELLEAMSGAGWMENTLVVFASDHGEEFIEHGGLGHEHTLYQELVHVPLILAGPGVTPGAVIRENVSLVDVAPTVLEAVGLEPPLPMDGVSLWGSASRGETPPERDIFMEETYIGQRYPVHLLLSVLRGESKIIGSTFHVRGAGPWSWELYDLAADPAESERLEKARPGLAGELRSVVMEWFRRGPGPGSGAPASEERLELLRSLGYVD